MAQYKVLMQWTNADGEHQPGETVEIVTETTEQKVERDKLVQYGIVEEIPEEAQSEQGSAKKK